MSTKFTNCIAPTLASVVLLHSVAYGYGQAPDLICFKETKWLPACGAGDGGQGPNAPPLSAVITANSSTSSMAIMVAGGTFINTVTDEEKNVPPMHIALRNVLK